MGDITLTPDALYAVDILANEASGKEADGVLTAQESAKFCAMEIPRYDDCDSYGETIARFKELLCGNAKPTGSVSYWTGIKDSSGKIHTVTNPQLREKLMKADLMLGDANGVTTPNEIVMIRFDLGVVNCSMNFSSKAGKILRVSGECTFDANTKECKPFDAALKAISPAIFTEVSQELEESLSVYGETLRSIIPEKRSK